MKALHVKLTNPNGSLSIRLQIHAKKTKQNKKQLTTVETVDGARLTSAGQTKNYKYRYFTEAVEKAFKYERKIK